MNPEVSIVSLAVFDGPICRELAILFVMLLPKAEAPEAEAVLIYPTATEYSPEAVFDLPRAEAPVVPNAVLAKPIADE